MLIKMVFKSCTINVGEIDFRFNQVFVCIANPYTELKTLGDIALHRVIKYQMGVDANDVIYGGMEDITGDHFCAF